MGGRKSELSSSTVDAGEPDPGDPAEGRGESGYGTVGGKDGRYIGIWNHLNGMPADSVERSRILRSRMREIRSSGSVGGGHPAQLNAWQVPPIPKKDKFNIWPKIAI